MTSERMPARTKSYLERIDVTPRAYVAVCGDCGQEDGPFRNMRLAERMLKGLGWRRVTPVEAWDPTLSHGGGWAPGPHPHEWRCGHCLVAWEYALIRRQAFKGRTIWIPWTVTSTWVRHPMPTTVEWVDT